MGGCEAPVKGRAGFNAGCFVSMRQSSLEVCVASLASWSPQISQSRCGACESPVVMDRYLR